MLSDSLEFSFNRTFGSAKALEKSVTPHINWNTDAFT